MEKDEEEVRFLEAAFRMKVLGNGLFADFKYVTRDMMSYVVTVRINGAVRMHKISNILRVLNMDLKDNDKIGLLHLRGTQSLVYRLGMTASKGGK